MVISYIYFVDVGSLVIHAKFQDQYISDSEVEDFKCL